MYTLAKSEESEGIAETPVTSGNGAQYRGKNWVSWLSARLLQYTKAHYPCVATPLKKNSAAGDHHTSLPVFTTNTRAELNERYQFNRAAKAATLPCWESLGIQPESWIISNDAAENNAALRRLVDAKVKELEPYKHRRNFPVIKNVEKMGELLNLPKVATDLLCAVCVAKTGAPVLEWLFGRKEHWDENVRIEDVIRDVFGCSKKDLAELKDPESKLRMLSLPCIDWTTSNSWVVTTYLMNNAYAEAWAERRLSVKQLTASYFTNEPRSRLTVDNFDYMSSEVQLLVDFLREASTKGTTGANVFLYGPPGTGKTQLARTIVKAAGLSLYGTRDISTTNTQFNAYHTAQLLLDGTTTNSCFLMDESEDFFNRGEFVEQQTSSDYTLSKYRLNATFENNPVPTIWIGNSLRRIDPAHLRRFGVVLEVPVPPRGVRAQVFRKYSRGLRLSQAWIDDMAQNVDITPADIESAASVLKTAGTRKGKSAEREMRTLLKEKLKVRGENYVRVSSTKLSMTSS